jgi:hypothetical protein
MSIVADRMNPKAATPPPPTNDPKGMPLQKPLTPQPLAAALPSRDPNADLVNQNQDGFFGSFFKQKKRPGILEAVCDYLCAVKHSLICRIASICPQGFRKSLGT